jgi:hypothetical protein
MGSKYVIMKPTAAVVADMAVESPGKKSVAKLPLIDWMGSVTVVVY